jgi:hypothetical protein
MWISDIRASKAIAFGLHNIWRYCIHPDLRIIAPSWTEPRNWPQNATIQERMLPSAWYHVLYFASIELPLMKSWILAQPASPRNLKNVPSVRATRLFKGPPYSLIISENSKKKRQPSWKFEKIHEFNWRLRSKKNENFHRVIAMVFGSPQSYPKISPGITSDREPPLGTDLVLFLLARFDRDTFFLKYNALISVGNGATRIRIV